MSGTSTLLARSSAGKAKKPNSSPKNNTALTRPAVASTCLPLTRTFRRTISRTRHTFSRKRYCSLFSIRVRRFIGILFEGWSQQSQLGSYLPRVSRQFFSQRLASARYARFHRSKRNREHVRDLFVRHFFQVAQYHRCPIRLGDLSQRLFHRFAYLGMRELFERRVSAIRQPLFSTTFVFAVRDWIDRRFLSFVPEPPAPAICRFVQSDAVDP